jgi:hypothetical protein
VTVTLDRRAWSGAPVGTAYAMPQLPQAQPAATGAVSAVSG